VIYTPYLGKGQKGKPVNLGPADMTVGEVWAAYERETAQPTDTLNWLLNEYHQSAKFKSRKERTRKDYAEYRDKLAAYPMANGKPFGTAVLSKIKRTAIQKYLDKHHAPILANRQIQYLKSAWNWALNRYEQMPPNPCVGVELNPQNARTRYVSQDEFRAFRETTAGYIPLFMELGYLCRARWSEVARLTDSDLTDDGVVIIRGKGSVGEITAWTPRLRKAIAECKAFNADAPTPITGGYLIHDSRGNPIKQNTFQAAWGRAMRAWVKNGGERFTFHDLKAAGYSDQEQQFAGHKSERMHSVYNRKLRIVEPPG
jgi:integrase